MICYLVPIFVPISVDLTTRFPHAHTLPHSCICQPALRQPTCSQSPIQPTLAR